MQDWMDLTLCSHARVKCAGWLVLETNMSFGLLQKLNLCSDLAPFKLVPLDINTKLSFITGDKSLKCCEKKVQMLISAWPQKSLHMCMTMYATDPYIIRRS